MKKEKALRKLQSGSKNINFSEAVAVAEAFGFHLDRINGSHHIFIHYDRRLKLNLQDVKGKAKDYQMRQLLDMIEKYGL